MRTSFLLLLSIVLVDCSTGNSGETDPTAGMEHNHLNACTTLGATYLVQCVEKKGGNCGPLIDQIYIADQATIKELANQHCEAVNQTGCNETATNCPESLVAANGVHCDITTTYSTTFKQDGSGATSIETIALKCDNGEWCRSTYDCTFTRQ